MRLTGRVAIVPVGASAEVVVERLAAEGATIVLVDGGGEEAGRLATAVEAQGARAAVFEGDDVDALVEFLDEVFQ